MFTRDTKICVVDGKPVDLGSLADKALVASRVGETFEITIPVYDIANDTIVAAKATVKQAEKQAAVVTLVNHVTIDHLTCDRNMEVYIRDKGWVKASEVEMGDRSRMPAVRYEKAVTIAAKIIGLKYPTVPMDVVEVKVQGDLQAFFVGSVLVRNPAAPPEQ